MNVSEYLSKCNIAIVKHTYTPTGGAEQELLRYLLPRAKTITYLSHPFSDARGVPLNTSISFYEDGRLQEETLAPLVRGPSPLLFAKDVLFTLWYLRKRGRRFQLYMGVDNLNAFSGLLLRRLGLVERVIYYVIDYAPHRFSLRAAQKMYRILDRRCCYGSDAVWNVSQSMEEARRLDGARPGRCAPQIEVPLGSRYSEIPRLSPEKIDGKLLVFLGNLTPEQGVNLMIEAMARLVPEMPGVRLRIIGDGPESGSLLRLARERGVLDSIEFTGYVMDDFKAAQLLAEGAIGVAPYIDTGNTYKRFADPGKVKIYLAAGLPIVISRVPPVAKLIEESGAGISVEPTVDSLAEALAGLLRSPEKIQKMRANAMELGKKYDWDAIFERAFERTFECLGIDAN